MLADPVAGFFDGLGSGFTRTAFAFVAILAGAAVCYLSLGFDVEWSALYLWAPLLIGLLFWWAVYGGWFFVGLSAFVLMFAFIWSFTQERAPKLSFFAVFSAATVYFAPICFEEHRWIRAIVIYSVCALLYWILPYAFLRLNRNA